jgi:hypothetical protein
MTLTKEAAQANAHFWQHGVGEAGRGAWLWAWHPQPLIGWLRVGRENFQQQQKHVEHDNMRK